MNFEEIVGKNVTQMMFKVPQKQSFALSSGSVLFEIYSQDKAWGFLE